MITRTPDGEGRLELLVLRSDGRPAAGAKVRGEIRHELASVVTRLVRTDETGRAVFKGLPDCDVRVSVHEPGYLAPPEEAVAVEDGVVARLTIAEAVGAVSLVTVVDAEWLPVPFARIEVADRNGVQYAWLSGGVQRLALRTDADGRIVLPNLPPEEIGITATLGSRRTTARIRGGEPLELVLTDD